ncbi:FAD-binding and (Fe-S)-binding domain-containing protein [Saccharomonospora xinjiangensis]|uniref:FAD/FMN-dependent dehydrogenase n=1 Tax=Saccharomonospora xinjiangensis XJ-54 TaxID=882086 RepID=I0UZS7_9PSEU|nr:FAD-binding and (Fe-S)-binding domain-containing protein [Saccharomonospora xinjiangensis]EID53380.1 FAD/FMN-dependent dehydrogenase [Saccharomonospora xinjiangensis XJ-54]
MTAVTSLADALARAVSGEVDASTGARAMFGMDASNYRHVPSVVVFPRTADDVAAALRVARDHGVSVTARGAGTGIGGQALGEGVVLDYSRHLDRVIDIDPERRTARVQPGVVLDRLREAAARHGLTFGPDPSTHSRCTLGGMLGNDACGPHSVAWGRTADNVVSLEVITGDGARLSVGPGDRVTGEPSARASEIRESLRDLAQGNLAVLRTGFPSLPRRVSGYALDNLLPENGTDIARALVGTEGTCVLLTEATVRLVPSPRARVLVVAGFADDIAAADAVPQVLPHQPLTVEGMGADLVEILLVRGPRPAALDALPAGRGWLFVEVGGDDPGEARRNAEDLAAALARETGAATSVTTDPARQRQLWAIRESAAGIATRMADGSEAWPGWEDAAVPPERLGSYLRSFRQLLDSYGLRGIPYGHFGEGCVHIRIDFDLLTDDGVATFRRFLADAANLVVAHGGSLSGEHGDGQARAELLPRMYSPEMIRLFEVFKAVWDPDGVLNPGNLVRPRPLDADLRFSGPRTNLPITLRYPHDGGSLATAARRCVGVGKCVDTTTGVMCPSYMVTRREEHSTRGRARLLFEMLRGEVVTSGWDSEEVRDALDLCLACKGCLSDCPVNVDMAAYKAEFLHHHYAGRPRPASHYSLGFLPVWARLAALAPCLVNGILRSPTVSSLVKRLGGIAAQRELPAFARTTLRRAWRHKPRRNTGIRPKVVLWPDTFTDHFAPEIGVAATRVLEHVGFDVTLPRSPVCCGLTWISTGQLGIARRVLSRTLDVLREDIDAGTPIVGLEPSCLAVLRHDVHDLLDTPPVPALTLAEFLDRHAPDAPFEALDAHAVTQRHCHQHAVLGHDADEKLLRRAGIHNRTLDSGCCGLAGNFGVERGHYDVSVAAANRVLVPEIDAAGPEVLVLADGFSCRTQIADLTGRRSLHLAQVLDRARPGRTP